VFVEKLRAAQKANNSFLCIGLDPDPALMAHPHIPSFFTEIIEQTKDLVCAYKPNLAFFEALGFEGMQTMLESIRAVPKHIPIIADAKRGDIGNTARFYAKAIFEIYKFDACTLNPYGGREAVEPFWSMQTAASSSGAAVRTRRRRRAGPAPRRRPARVQAVASRRGWNTRGNVGVVAGATYPNKIERARDRPDQVLLVPGVGAQQGAVEDAAAAAMDSECGGFLINASRGVTYASRGDDYADAARKEARLLRNRINVMREAALARG
jgi:orotidine-5'-phosphate decarboxylase